ncbi:zinc C3HC4 type domain-containing protein [Cryptosporidium andersoni]|uniref:Zinc C3HC4 type domain-containing protein n=1 Tax=Cryptosporidium andersoni TaxID=117008 RepID=A0A1J4ME64_9CRYT|nr:zinc C3HC4 type domain-containing protein [Cryptosporidium andersoni]
MDARDFRGKVGKRSDAGKNQSSVIIQSTTSSGESHGLFDYERKGTISQTIFIDGCSNSYTILKSNNSGLLSAAPNEGNCENCSELNNPDNFEVDHYLICDTKNVTTEHGDDTMEPMIKLFKSKGGWYVDGITLSSKTNREHSLVISMKEILNSQDNGHSKQYKPYSWTECRYSDDSIPNKGNKVWIVSPKHTPGIPLRQGDIIKLGRCQMRVHEIVATLAAAKDALLRTPYIPTFNIESNRELNNCLDILAFEVNGIENVKNSQNSYGIKGENSTFEKTENEKVTNLCTKSQNGNMETAPLTPLSGILECEDKYKQVKKNLTISLEISDKDEMTPLKVIESSSHNLRHQQIIQTSISEDDHSGNLNNRNIDDIVQSNQTFSIAISTKNNSNNATKFCRICLSDDGDLLDCEDNFNPLICPCDCRGSMQYVHLQCLRKWIESRLGIPASWMSNITSTQINLNTTRNNACSVIRGRLRRILRILYHQCINYFSCTTSGNGNRPVCFNLRKFDCELCKVTFPNQLWIPNGESLLTLPLFRIPRPKYPYIILVPIESEYTCKISQIIVSFGDPRSSVYVGRGHNSDVRFGEISVSRSHAQLQHCFICGDYEICLSDRRSKFGSLVELSRPFKIGKEGISLQIGKTLIFLKTVKSKASLKNILLPCITEKNINNVSLNRNNINIYSSKGHNNRQSHETLDYQSEIQLDQDVDTMQVQYNARNNNYDITCWRNLLRCNHLSRVSSRHRYFARA